MDLIRRKLEELYSHVTFVRSDGYSSRWLLNETGVGLDILYEDGKVKLQLEFGVYMPWVFALELENEVMKAIVEEEEQNRTEGSRIRMNQIFKTKQSKIPLTEEALKIWAGTWFTMDRIKGNHCECNGEGEFVLLEKHHPSVVESGKEYMVCRKCNGWSHL